MNKFNYLNLKTDILLPNSIKKIESIYQYQQNLNRYKKLIDKPLKKYIKRVSYESTIYANTFDNIKISKYVLKWLINKKIKPRNYEEKICFGYKELFDYISENYNNIYFTSQNLLSLQEDLYKYIDHIYKSEFRQVNKDFQYLDKFNKEANLIDILDSLLIEEYIEKLVNSYEEAITNNIEPLILIPSILLDYLNIYPFMIGTQKLFLILINLLLYQNNLDIFKYISIEKKLVENIDNFYDTLKKSSNNWKQNKNNKLPFITFFIDLIYDAYKEMDIIFSIIVDEKSTTKEKILSLINIYNRPFARKEIIDKLVLSKRKVDVAIKELQEENKIEKVFKGPKTKYQIKNPV